MVQALHLLVLQQGRPQVPQANSLAMEMYQSRMVENSTQQPRTFQAVQQESHSLMGRRRRAPLNQTQDSFHMEVLHRRQRQVQTHMEVLHHSQLEVQTHMEVMVKYSLHGLFNSHLSSHLL